MWKKQKPRFLDEHLEEVEFIKSEIWKECQKVKKLYYKYHAEKHFKEHRNRCVKYEYTHFILF